MPLAVLALMPVAGPHNAATVVRILGTDFQNPMEVEFNGAIIPNVYVSAGEVTVTTPAVAAAREATVRVRVPAVAAPAAPPGPWVAAFAPFYYEPVITGVVPARGSTDGGDDVVVNGTGFVNTTVVKFGGVDLVSKQFVAAGSIRGKTPQHDAIGQVDITTGFLCTHANGYAYGAPAVASVQPAQGVLTGKRVVTITGNDFSPVATVAFGLNQATVTSRSPTKIVVEVPPGAAVGNVAVDVANVNNVQQDNGRNFRYTAVPFQGAASSVTPATTVGNGVVFHLDGEEFFPAFRALMAATAALPVNPLTYVRLACWKINKNTTLADHATYPAALADDPENAAHDPTDPLHDPDSLAAHIRAVLVGGHNVDSIVWVPAWSERKMAFEHIAATTEAFRDMVAQVDRDVAALPAGPIVPGRARCFLELYGSQIGMSQHQKMAIFSNAGQRTVLIGGINYSPEYYDMIDHRQCHSRGHWHETAASILGPATADIEKEWVRRWDKAVALVNSKLTSRSDVAKQVSARALTLNATTAVRQASVQLPANNTPQAAQPANIPITIALTRQDGVNIKHIRELLLERIAAANQYVFLENSALSDPDIVRALYTRKAAVPGLVISVLTNGGGGPLSYLTRRAWLQLVLRMPHGICQRVDYLHENGAAGFILKTGAHDGGVGWAVSDTSRDLVPASWLDGDRLTIRCLAHNVDEAIPFHKITAVRCGFHFYSPTCFRGTDVAHMVLMDGNCAGCGTGLAGMVIHSKLAVIDGRYLVIGTSNWTYRSMDYDGEMAAFIDDPGVAAASLTRVLNHYQTYVAPAGPGAITPLNMEAVAEENVQAILDAALPRQYGVDRVDETLLLPLDHHLLTPVRADWSMQVAVPSFLRDKTNMPNHKYW